MQTPPRHAVDRTISALDARLSSLLDAILHHPQIKHLESLWRAREAWIEGRLVISPHAAFYSPPSVIDLRSFGVRTIMDCLTTGSLQNCVNLEYLRRN